jgi:glucose-1-phosphate thymidylyltransferase
MKIFKKGIILAGGLGTRLYPTTKVISKQILPVFDKPMIYYSIANLIRLGIKLINIISDPINILKYKKLLGDGKEFRIRIFYVTQAKPNGIAQSIILSKNFIKNDNCILLLGDNIFFGGNFEKQLFKAASQKISSIFVKKVLKPNKYGVIKYIDKNNLKIIEKPKKFISNYAVTGLYFYTKEVSKFVKKIKLSKRGELEITDLNNIFLRENLMKVRFLDKNCSWFDAGTYSDLLLASNKVFNLTKKKRRELSDLKYLSKKLK